VPGAEVLLQGGLYGTIVSYDPDNLDQPAIVELAPGVEIKVHSGAILRVVTPTEDSLHRGRARRRRADRSGLRRGCRR
jgi:preprotein translocase subunit YajC